jgi:GTP-binding protein HflX
MIGERIKSIKKQLEKVKKQRSTQRRARERNQTFRVSLVGYTNAGKSTLFNALVHADAYAADQLFATLDTTTRQLHLDGIERGVALSDTVGFIRDLPHSLIEAFQATLQEAADADLLLHVVDAASPELAEQMREVERVLDEIGAGAVEQIVVFNKIDRLDETERPRTLADAVELPSGRRVPRRFVSAVSGEGLDALRACIAELAVREAPADGLNAEAEPSSEDGPDGAGDEGEDLRVGTYHSHA